MGSGIEETVHIGIGVKGHVIEYDGWFIDVVSDLAIFRGLIEADEVPSIFGCIDGAEEDTAGQVTKSTNMLVEPHDHSLGCQRTGIEEVLAEERALGHGCSGGETENGFVVGDGGARSIIELADNAVILHRECNTGERASCRGDSVVGFAVT